MVSINTNISSLIAQQNLSKADAASQSSIARLSSGNRIIRASDDAAGLAVGTGLRTDVSTLRTALTNTSQANSVLSIADGALFNIGEILQRQKALAAQANSGSLSDTERVFLDSEFQKLTAEIDRIADSTNFNGIKLIDGSISGNSGITTDTSSTEAKQTVLIDFAAAIDQATDGTLVINGITFTIDTTDDSTDLNAGATTINLSSDTAETINGTVFDTSIGTGGNDIAAAIAEIINNIENPSLGITSQTKIDALKGLTASASGGNLTITSRAVGGAGVFVVDHTDAGNNQITDVTAGTITATTGTAVSSVSSSSSDVTGSLGEGVVTVSGIVGNTVLRTLSQTYATLSYTNFAAGDLDNDDTIQVFGRLFTLKTNVTDEDTQIKVGTTDAATLANVVSFLNNSQDPTISQYTYNVNTEGSLNITYTAKSANASHNDTNNAFAFYDVDGSGDDQDATDGVAQGVDVSGITDNDQFIGTLSGFTATYAGSDRVVLSVKVGDYTYQGIVSDTTPGANTKVRLFSQDANGKGGYFDIELAASQGTTVNNQTTADTYVATINDAFGTLSFQQTREINSFDLTGTLLEGGKVYLKSEDFSNINVSSVSVVQRTATNGNGAISIKLADGRVFENTTLGQKLHAGEKISLQNISNGNETIDIYVGTTDINLESASQTARLQSELTVGLSSNTGGLSFQIGIEASDTIAVQVDSSKTTDLFGGLSLDLLSVANAVAAGDQLDIAINAVTALRADIGALQSRFDFAASNLETTIQNTDAARGDFLDANIADESTTFATNQVLLQASISVLAQANQLPQNLLKLIG